MFTIRVGRQDTSRLRSNAGHATGLCGLVGLVLALTGCPRGGVPADVAIVGLEATTYVNDSITFDVVVVGGGYDSLELLRDGELFAVMTGTSYNWDVGAAPEASYSFIARARSGEVIVDSAPKVVVVDRTPPLVTLSVTLSQEPLMAGSGQVELSASASDDVLLARLELVDGEDVVGSGLEAIDTVLTPGRGTHEYRARGTDRAGNTTLTPTQTVPAYVRETHTLTSEPALDGCISVGYLPEMFTRAFDTASCGWTTSFSITHHYSFDRSAYSGAVVEEATLKIYLLDGYDPYVHLASVEYDVAEDAPPTEFSYPFESTVPETMLAISTTPPTGYRTIDVTALAQADVAAGRMRTQLRLRTQALGPGTLGGTGYLAEVGDDRAPTLELELLVP